MDAHRAARVAKDSRVASGAEALAGAGVAAGHAADGAGYAGSVVRSSVRCVRAGTLAT